MSKCLPPVIKWPGSKRSVAARLATLFPEANRYFEPFVGGGAMLPYRQAQVAYASDILPELIALWIAIRDGPTEVAAGYRERWRSRQRDGHLVYYAVRDRFNANRDPIDFLFLSRTCVNGLIRFNKNGDFNNSLHHTRPGISPETLEEILLNWSAAIQSVTFGETDYRVALADVREGDFVFLDPPYEATKGRYRPDSFNTEAFYAELDRLNRIGTRWMLTYDGQAGRRVYQVGLPQELYKARIGISTGNSPFTRLMGTTIDAVVESVYLNYEPPGQLGCNSMNESDEPRQLSVIFDMEDGSATSAVKFES